MGAFTLYSSRFARNLFLLVFPADTPGLLFFDEQALRNLPYSSARPRHQGGSTVASFPE